MSHLVLIVHESSKLVTIGTYQVVSVQLASPRNGQADLLTNHCSSISVPTRHRGHREDDRDDEVDDEEVGPRAQHFLVPEQSSYKFAPLPRSAQ